MTNSQPHQRGTPQDMIDYVIAWAIGIAMLVPGLGLSFGFTPSIIVTAVLMAVAIPILKTVFSKRRNQQDGFGRPPTRDRTQDQK